jgi:hypothetical protein
MPAKIIFAKQLFGAGKELILSPFADNWFSGENMPLISRNVVCLLSATDFAEGCCKHGTAKQCSNCKYRNRYPCHLYFESEEAVEDLSAVMIERRTVAYQEVDVLAVGDQQSDWSQTANVFFALKHE